MKNKRRWMEAGKSLLILLLSASALFLLSLTPLIRESGIADLFTGDKGEDAPAASLTMAAAARPIRLALTWEGGRHAVQYDQESVDALFADLAPLLGEALTTSGQPRTITERRWRNYLEKESIYFDFEGTVPLSALGLWLSSSGQCTLEQSVRRVLLCAGSGNEVLLCFREEDTGKIYMCTTGLTRQLHLTPAFERVEDNEASFAYENHSTASLVEPYTLITEEPGRSVYTASTPVAPGGDLSWLLSALDYTGRNHASVSGGELYLDGNDRLYIAAGGQVSFDAAQGGKYPVTVLGSSMTAAEAIEAARALAQSTVGARCGSAELALRSAQRVEGGWDITFDYLLDGSPVWLYDQGWAASFAIREGYITNFTLWFRTYTPTGEEGLLTPMELAAVMLPDLADTRRELVIAYRDGGETVLMPAWIAR